MNVLVSINRWGASERQFKVALVGNAIAESLDDAVILAHLNCAGDVFPIASLSAALRLVKLVAFVCAEDLC